MTYEEAGGIATLFTSILVLFTLWEMKVQRESIYYPDIVFQSSGYIYMYKERNGAVFIPSLWLSKEVDFHPVFIGDEMYTDDDKMSFMEFDHIIEENLIKPINISFYNLGMGAAKNIEIEWICNPEYTIDELLKINLDKETWPHDKEFVWRNRFGNLDLKQKIDYILPIGLDSSNEINQIYIPNVIQKFINLFLVMCADSILSKELKLAKIPDFYIKVKYNDLVNEQHSKIFTISFTVESGDIKKFRKQRITLDNIKMKYQIIQLE